MAELNSEAEKLVQAGRAALRPSQADQERVFAALLPRVGVAIGAGAAAGGATRATLLKVSAALVGLGLIGGGLFLAQRSEPTPVNNVVPAPASPAPAAAPPVDPMPENVAPVAPPAEPTAKRTPVPSRSADNLAREVAILSRASSELRAGRAAAALKTLEEHQREFPAGMLAQERTAARIQALCALGRTKQAETELGRLARTAPDSPHVARARKACGFDSTKKE
ncbi:MAG TPA: hypothetical protein VMS65_03550 [Polyangiaceae bacterium]|nr:hypothetical protein [Polyangiaceae bacterium]